MLESHTKMEKIVSLCKRRGFVWQGSEIYGGVGAIWHFGPLGVEMKNAIKRHWWATFVYRNPDVVGMDSAIIMHPRTWEASGHIQSFTDPLVECKKCHTRYRADHMAEGRFCNEGKAKEKNQCPACGSKDFTDPQDFNLMFKTFLGAVEDTASETYLRPETAQGMFVDFKQIQETSRKKIPFGIAQIGKSFRNEITTGDFFFRSREFEIAEIEYFVEPGEDEKAFDRWYKSWKSFYVNLGINKDKLRDYEHPQTSLAHYSIDIEYQFPFGWGELAGVANRTDYDLKQHQKFSGKDLYYFDTITGRKYIPYVIEPTMGIERIMLAALVDGYLESDGSDGREKGEVVLKLSPVIAPIQVAVFPLVKKDKLPELGQQILQQLNESRIRSIYDESGSIGRRYRRQDEVGTPWCVTVDFQTLEDDSVTVRDRDSLKQERVKLDKLKDWFFLKLNLS
jgi:glycyl-tRNA synthetase